MKHEEFCSLFLSEFEVAKNDPLSEIGFAYLPEQVSMNGQHSAEWSAVMGLFLARLARKAGFAQQWECKSGFLSRRVDFTWHSPGAGRSSRVHVAIEHESWFERREAMKKCIIEKLLACRPTLAVLIAYTDRDRWSRVVEYVQARLTAAESELEVLVILSDGSVDSTSLWTISGVSRATSREFPVASGRAEG
jgi:hypothetical protein